MKWVTREHPKTDRIACPWLIKNFIDTDAEFLYVPAGDVLAVAEREGAHSYDAKGARYTHRDGLCSFEVLVEEYKISDPAVHLLARIVHGADVSEDRDATPQSPGLQAVAEGFHYLDSRRRPPPARAGVAGVRRAVSVVQAPGWGRAGLTRDARLIITVQALRAFAYGVGSVLIGVGLAQSQLSGTQVGVVFAAILLGAAFASVALGRYGDRDRPAHRLPRPAGRDGDGRHRCSRSPRACRCSCWPR